MILQIITMLIGLYMWIELLGFNSLLLVILMIIGLFAAGIAMTGTLQLLMLPLKNMGELK